MSGEIREGKVRLGQIGSDQIKIKSGQDKAKSAKVKPGLDQDQVMSKSDQFRSKSDHVRSAKSGQVMPGHVQAHVMSGNVRSCSCEVRTGEIWPWSCQVMSCPIRSGEINVMPYHIRK